MVVLALDDLPEFKGLVIQSSNLMICAKSLRAKGETFEAAARWVEAGRVRGDLGQCLVDRGHLRPGAEDILIAAACFLEAGDHRPADQQLSKMRDGTPLGEVVLRDRALSAQYKELMARSDKCRQSFESIRAEGLRQMEGRPQNTRLLNISWLRDKIAELPGIPDLHFSLARRYFMAENLNRAVYHHDLCTQLKPDYAEYRMIFIFVLTEAERWNEAVSASDEAVSRFANKPLIQWSAGWAKLLAVFKGRRPDSMLPAAQQHFEAYLYHDGLLDDQRVDAILLIAACLIRQGKPEEAKQRLMQAVRDYPLPTAKRAWQLAHARSPGDKCELQMSRIRRRWREQFVMMAA